MNKWYPFLIVLATVLFYGSSLRYGFSQDDFYFLLISQADNLGDILKFFSPWHQQGFPFFRPIGTQLYYYSATAIAGFKNAPYLMHVFMLVLQAANGYLAYALTGKLTGSKGVARWVGILYVTAGAQFLSLYYIAATQQLLAAFLGLLSLNFLLSRKFNIGALFFALALLSKENAIVIPVIGALLYQLTDSIEKTSKKTFLNFVHIFTPSAVVVFAYLLLRFSAGMQVQSEYHPVIGPSLISTLRWYYLFAVGAPEQLISYGLPGMFINFWRFIRDFGWLAAVSAVTTVLLSLILLVVSARGLLNRGPVKRFEVVTYYLWWLLGIGLIIWFPDHRYPHYLDIGLLPLLILLVSSFKKDWAKLTVSGLMLISSWACIQISLQSHWTVKRAEIAERAVSAILTSDSCQQGAVTFAGPGNEPQEVSYILSLANGPRYLCDNPDLGVYYKGMANKSEHVGTVIETGKILR